MRPVKKSRLLLLSSVFLVLAAVFGWRHFSCTEVTATCGGQMSVSEDVLPQTSQVLAPRYLSYSQAGVEDALAGGQRVILYFYAPWCSTCSDVDTDLLAGTAQVPLGVTVFRINYDRAPALKQRYGVTVQHTFVQLDSSQNPRKLWVGGDMAELEQRVI